MMHAESEGDMQESVDKAHKFYSHFLHTVNNNFETGYQIDSGSSCSTIFAGMAGKSHVFEPTRFKWSHGEMVTPICCITL